MKSGVEVVADTYTEEEVNRMLADQKTYLRLDGVESAVKELTLTVTNHIRDEKTGQKELLKKVSEGSIERRQCEGGLRKTISDHHELYHGTFVKKTDLKLYAVIIIAAVSITTGFITWIGAQTSSSAQDHSMNQIIERIDKMARGNDE